MQFSHRMRNRALAISVAGLLGVVGYVVAQGPDPVPPPPPPTLWNFLGIPQGANKVKDALLNPLGNHPKLERKPALKQIADPANLKADNLAIKAAAKAKADADLAPQKIKAIKYLATVCCGCAKNKDDVKDALLAALDDCTEEVRYEAAIAFCECAGNVCVACNSGSCCDAKMMNKLLKVSEGKDEQGCWLEASARVRAAAANALNACRQVRGPQGAVEPKPKGGEGPRELPSEEKAPRKTGIQTLEEAGGADGRVLARPVGYLGVGEGSVAGRPGGASAEVPGMMVSDDPSSQLAGIFGRERRICPFGRWREGYYVPVEEGAPAAPVAPGEKVPGAKPPSAEEAAPSELGAPSPTALAQGTAMGGVPNMIGDIFFSRGLAVVGFNGGTEVNVPIGGGDGLFKVADDNNPIPQDRVFFNYNFFRGAVRAVDGNTRDFNRFVFGLEKTFQDGQSSVEVRLPFGNGLNSTQSFATDASLMATEIGNVPVVFKTLLWRNPCQAFSVGVAAVSPTARDGRFTDPNGDEFLVVQNNAWHIQPFFGWLWTPPCRRFFVEVFGELDVPTQGNTVLVPDRQTILLTRAGRYNDQSLAMMDVKVGYWLYRDPCARWVTGIAPTCELHYTTTLQNTDDVAGISNPFNRVDVLDVTGGVHFLLGQMSALTVACAAPVRQNENALFSAEVFVQFDRRF